MTDLGIQRPITLGPTLKKHSSDEDKNNKCEITVQELWAKHNMSKVKQDKWKLLCRLLIW